MKEEVIDDSALPVAQGKRALLIVRYNEGTENYL